MYNLKHGHMVVNSGPLLVLLYIAEVDLVRTLNKI